MRIKVIHREDMITALAAVRVLFGEDALLLSSRTSRQSGVELTIAVDNDEKNADHDVLPLPPTVPHEDAVSLHVWHGCSGLPLSQGAEEAEFRVFLERRITYTPLDLSSNSPPLMVCGSPGSGKTLTVARLATRLVLSGQRPIVITTDNERTGAVEQLAACTRILGIDLMVADDIPSLQEACAHGAHRAVIIDTAATVPHDPIGRELLTELSSYSGSRLLLVHPCGEAPEETRDTVRWFRDAGAQGMIVSRGDCARRLGGIIWAGLDGIPLCEISLGSRLLGSLYELTASKIHELMIQARERAKSVIPSTESRGNAAASEKIFPEGGTSQQRRRSVGVSGALALSMHIAAQGRV